MKKQMIVSPIIIGVILLTSFSVFVVAENEQTENRIILDYEFNVPVINNIEIAGTFYDQLEINGAPNCGNPGEPSLPSRGAYILLPQGTSVNEITVTYNKKVNLGSSFKVEPVGECVPLSYADLAPLFIPNETIYNYVDPFPGKFFTDIGTYTFRGYKILILKLYPIQYMPASGELFYYPKLTVSVETVNDETINPLFRRLEKDKLEVIKKVDNPDIVTSFTKIESEKPTVDEYDLLIITTEALKDGFIPLKKAHDVRDVRTVIKTLSDIGSSSPDDIRDYIRYAYNNWGIEYVLLGGDKDVVPVKYLYFGEALNNTVFGVSDLYFGGLDDTWNTPEMPNPLNRDISITDPGVDGSSDGVRFLSGPYVDYSDYIKGNSSMQWKSTKNYLLRGMGNCKLTFDPPLNLSSMNWFNFYTKASRNLCFYLFYINIYSCEGREISYSPMFKFPTPEIVLFKNSWMIHHFYLPEFTGAEDFNWNEVETISLTIMTTIKQNRIGDALNLDGVYFSKWSDNIGAELGENSDLYAEVYVGRAPVENKHEVNNFVSKTIKYMSQSDEDYLKNVLMVGEYLGFDKNTGWGGNYNNELVDGSSNHNYSTVGIPSDEYNIKTLYDLDWEKYGWPKPKLIGGGWPKREIIKSINKGVHIINNLGHSYQNLNMKMWNLDVYRLKNKKNCFIYSQGCLAGAFDKRGYLNDCIAERLTVKTKHGAFAGIWNSDLGWFRDENTDGPSQRFNREFWDAVFGENITVISKANQDSKEDNIWRIDEEYMRYVYYELTLFGDPCIFLLKSENKKNTEGFFTNKKPVYNSIIEHFPLLEQMLKNIKLK